ncbi:hypothetical protein CYMTET_21716, partial [Cymbomonas tetramitiformis]
PNRGKLWVDLNKQVEIKKGETKPTVPQNPFSNRDNCLRHAYRAARSKIQRLLHKSKMRGWIAEIKRYNNPPRLVVMVACAMLLLVDERQIDPYLGDNLDRFPNDRRSLWMIARKTIDLNMRSPMYIIKRMNNVKQQGRLQSENQDLRWAAAEKIVSDISHKDAKRSSLAAGILWKWVLLVIAEHKIESKGL